MQLKGRTEGREEQHDDIRALDPAPQGTENAVMNLFSFCHGLSIFHNCCISFEAVWECHMMGRKRRSTARRARQGRLQAESLGCNLRHAISSSLRPTNPLPPPRHKFPHQRNLVFCSRPMKHGEDAGYRVINTVELSLSVLVFFLCQHLLVQNEGPS